MSVCPYTFVTSFFKSKKESETTLSAEKMQTQTEAKALRVVVHRDGEEKVNVTLPSRSARWLIEVIPEDVVLRIREQGIPIDEIQKTLELTERLTPRFIFELVEPERTVRVWLE